MRYKRLLVFFTCSIFITALIVCFFSVFKVAKISISTTSITNSSENVKEIAYDTAKKHYGGNLFFISDSELKKELSKASPYINVKSVKKSYPNQLEISIIERKEVFCFVYQDKYYALDENLHIVSLKQRNQNNIDGLDNILLNLNVADFDGQTLKVGSNLKIHDNLSSSCLKELSNLIFENRKNLKSVELTVKKDGYFMRELTLTFKEGLVIVLQSLQEKTTDKFNKAVEYYLACENKGDTNKLFVNIHSTSGEIIITR